LPSIEDYRDIDRVMRSDFPHYCRKAIKITDRNGAKVPFLLNGVQTELHRTVTRMLDDLGSVRLIILKARQLGVSMYVLARLYWLTSLIPGRRSYILTHKDEATTNLFDRLKLMHDNMPDDYRHRLLKSNANELIFEGMDGAGYGVGTAENTDGGGRSLTLQNFHGSEVGFWRRPTQHFAGAMQAVAKVRGSEIYLESTANGIGNEFYKQWSLAERGVSDFRPIFLPWMLEPDYARALVADYQPSSEEEEYQRLYGLSDQQLCWLHFKNIDLGGEPGIVCPMFRQEFPATAAEAFQMSDKKSFIGAEYINRARRVMMDRSLFRHLPRILGVDLGSTNDSSYLIDRVGPILGYGINERFRSADTMATADHIAWVLKQNPDIDHAFIDMTGMGIGIVHYLKGPAGFSDRVTGVNFASGATDKIKYKNKRAEIWGRLREWFMDPMGADMPDDNSLHADIAAPAWGPAPFCRYETGMNRLQMEEKLSIRERLGFSPDGGDAAALTHSFNVEKGRPTEASWMDDYSGGQPLDWQAF
jgi:hypothetical protein